MSRIQDRGERTRNSREPGSPGKPGTKLVLNVAIVILFAVGLTVGALYEIFFGSIILALGVVLLAIRGYLGSGDRAVTGVLIFVAFATVAIQAIEYFLAP
ncbi:hypothetical protein [Rubrobacter aplysinae]|uniref:hypothetical protein n=1 Tax=Rubrobacter aplysinae TaxID=909625 RepID=UPI00064C2BAB|nr:hypothetical protein [Rubrobacter aplysinae]